MYPHGGLRAPLPRPSPRPTHLCRHLRALQGPRKVNHLFKADFFGERALLEDAPRMATVQAHTKLTCLALAREEFTQLLGPLQKLMEREKSPQVRGTAAA